MDGYLTADEFAQRLGVKRASVHRYRVRGDIPAPDRYVGRTPLWAEASVEAWLRQRPGHGWRKQRTSPEPVQNAESPHDAEPAPDAGPTAG